MFCAGVANGSGFFKLKSKPTLIKAWGPVSDRAHYGIGLHFIF